MPDIQKEKNHIVVNIVKGDNFSDSTKKLIKQHIKNGCLGEKVNIEVKIVNEISQERSGKIRAIVSQIT